MSTADYSSAYEHGAPQFHDEGAPEGIRMSRTVRLVVAASVAVTAIVSLQPAASAGTAVAVYNNNTCGIALFNPDGEVFVADDRCEDGNSAVTRVKLDSTSSGIHKTIWDHYGFAGDGVKWDASFAEGRVVYVQSCLGEWGGSAAASTVFSSTCGAWRKGVA